jgi:hypothetical protein
MSDKKIKLINDQKDQLLKALHHLAYSFKKLANMPQNINTEDEELLETWESFSVRFARVVDLFLARFVRTYILYHDPGFKGSLRDHINMAEKLSLIEDANWWLSLRELRNVTANEYNEKDLIQFYQRLFTECPKLLELKTTLQQLKL